MPADAVLQVFERQLDGKLKKRIEMRRVMKDMESAGG